MDARVYCAYMGVGTPVRSESRRGRSHEPRYYAVGRPPVAVERRARGAGAVPSNRDEGGGQAGTEVRRRSDVAQAAGEPVDPRLVGRGRGGLARPRVYGPPDRLVHAAHG